MSLDGDVTAAFFAAVNKVQKGLIFADVSRIRKQKLKNRRLQRQTKWIEEEPRPVKKFHNLAPVLLVQSLDSSKHTYMTLPFYYAFKVTSSSFFPFIEACEIPVQYFSSLTGPLSDLEKSLEQFAIPFPIVVEGKSLQDVLESPKDLWTIRNAILHEVFVMGGREMSVYLSLFYPPEFKCEDSSANSYLRGLRESVDLKRNDESTIRIVPLCYNKLCHQTQLIRFGFTKRQLSL